MRKLSEKELCLVKLIHLLSAGTLHEYGLSLEEVLEYIQTPIPRKGNKTALECIDDQGLEFIKEIEFYVDN